MIVDELGAWNFVRKLYGLFINNKTKYSSLKTSFNTTPSQVTYRNFLYHCDGIVYKWYERRRVSTRKAGLPNETKITGFVSAYNAKESDPSKEWRTEIEPTNLRFKKIVSGDLSGTEVARISLQLDTDFFSQDVDTRVERFMRDLCDVLNFGLTKGINDIHWKFVDKLSLGARIDDVVIYVYGTVNVDSKTRVVGKFIAYRLRKYLAKKSYGIPGTVQCGIGVPGAYMASECSYPVRDYPTQKLSSPFKLIDMESHGSSLGMSLGISLIENDFDISRCQNDYGKAFKHFRS